MSKIKIISGWSNPGGSTLHHINLTNLLNANGYDCTFYGPHDWHLGKCKSDKIQNATVGVHDIVITHFIQMPKVNRKKHILSCHEKHIFPLENINLSNIDVVQFVSEHQKEWHNTDHPSVIIPPPVERIEWTKPDKGVAGIIGSVDANKGVHKSIERALEAGYTDIRLYGKVIPQVDYYINEIQKYVDSGTVSIAGHYDNKQEMYNEIDEVFNSSLSETYGLVEAECKLAGIPFNGPSRYPIVLSDEEILERWKELLI